MSERPKPAPLLQERRELAVQALTRHYTNESIDVDELESRLDRLYRPRSAVEIDQLQSDLPALTESAPEGVAMVGAGKPPERPSG